MITTIGDSSHVGEARRVAAEFARNAGADDNFVGRVALVATEMATNIVKHAGGTGMLVVRRFSDAAGDGVELVAIDKGPGMADVKACMADGYSTAGSSGTGFGAISRQADVFNVYSRPSLGTVISTRFTLSQPEASSGSADVGVVTATYPGETVCGDDWAFAPSGRGQTLLVVDGSGHGPQAAAAANAATGIFGSHASEDCEALVERIHRGLSPTRGAALAVARVDRGQQLVRFVGVGNISGSMVTGIEVRQMVSHNGTVGHIAPRIREFTYPFDGAPIIIMHSDGLTNRWRPADYPGLMACHPSLIAGVLFRDFRRGRDDATIAVMRPR